jgi:hypothetical protein
MSPRKNCDNHASRGHHTAEIFGDHRPEANNPVFIERQSGGLFKLRVSDIVTFFEVAFDGRQDIGHWHAAEA